MYQTVAVLGAMSPILFFQQAWAEFLGALEGLLHFPFFDFWEVAAEEDFGDFPSVELGRACVDWCFEEVVLEGVVKCALLVANGAGNEPYDGVGDDSCGQFAAGEHIVAY